MMPLDQSGRVVSREQSLQRESQPSASQVKTQGQYRDRQTSSTDIHMGAHSNDGIVRELQAEIVRLQSRVK